jgi:hypothetical protein
MHVLKTLLSEHIHILFSLQYQEITLEVTFQDFTLVIYYIYVTLNSSCIVSSVK